MIDLFCYVDTESSGLFRDNLEPDHPSQPHIVEIACKVVTADAQRAPVSVFSRIIRPEGWTIEPDALAVHGISERLAYTTGVALWFALAELRASVELAPCKIIGFNIHGFDRRLIGTEIARSGHDDHWWTKRAGDIVDVMELAQPLMGLPGKIPGEFKTPSMQEAMRFFGPDEWQQEHRALPDVTACEFLHRAVIRDQH